MITPLFAISSAKDIRALLQAGRDETAAGAWLANEVIVAFDLVGHILADQVCTSPLIAPTGIFVLLMRSFEFAMDWV